MTGNHGGCSDQLPGDLPHPSEPADVHHELLDELLCTFETLQKQSRDIARLSVELRARLADMDREMAAQHPHDPDKPT